MAERKCADGSPWTVHYANASSIVALNQIVDVQNEIMAHGPVTAAFKVYEDFFHFKSGVYNGCSPPANLTRKIAGYHAVKIVGWGTTDIDPALNYWTVQNCEYAVAARKHARLVAALYRVLASC